MEGHKNLLHLTLNHARLVGWNGEPMQMGDSLLQGTEAPICWADHYLEWSAACAITGDAMEGHTPPTLWPLSSADQSGWFFPSAQQWWGHTWLLSVRAMRHWCIGESPYKVQVQRWWARASLRKGWVSWDSSAWRGEGSWLNLSIRV